MSAALDAGADDIKTDDEEIFEIITTPQNLDSVKESLSKKFKIISAEVTMLPENYIKLDGKEAEQMLALMDDLEEHDDVKNVYANFDIPKEVLEKLENK